MPKLEDGVSEKSLKEYIRRMSEKRKMKRNQIEGKFLVNFSVDGMNVSNNLESNFDFFVVMFTCSEYDKKLGLGLLNVSDESLSERSL